MYLCTFELKNKVKNAQCLKLLYELLLGEQLLIGCIQLLASSCRLVPPSLHVSWQLCSCPLPVSGQDGGLLQVLEQAAEPLLPAPPLPLQAFTPYIVFKVLTSGPFCFKLISLITLDLLNNILFWLKAINKTYKVAILPTLGFIWHSKYHVLCLPEHCICWYFPPHIYYIVDST